MPEMPIKSGLQGGVACAGFAPVEPGVRIPPPRFLDFYFGTREFVEACQRASEGTTNRVRLQPDRFLRIEIPLPPLPEQRRIVTRIEELSAKIEEARELRERAIEEATTSLMSEAGVFH